MPLRRHPRRRHHRRRRHHPRLHLRRHRHPRRRRRRRRRRLRPRPRSPARRPESQGVSQHQSLSGSPSPTQAFNAADVLSPTDIQAALSKAGLPLDNLGFVPPTPPPSHDAAEAQAFDSGPGSTQKLELELVGGLRKYRETMTVFAMAATVPMTTAVRTG